MRVTRFLCLAVLAAGFMSGCETVVSRNEQLIHDVLIEKQRSAGHHLSSFEIVDHIDSASSLTVMVNGTIDTSKTFSDTIRFPLTMDGFIVP